MNRIYLFLFVVLCAGGCDKTHHYQLLIHNESTLLEYPEVRAGVRGNILAFAKSRGLMDITHEAKRKEVVGYYKSPGHHSPIVLGVREVEGGFVVDFMQFYPGTAESEEYSKMKAHLEQYLMSVYGDGATVVPEDELIGIRIKEKM